MTVAEVRELVRAGGLLSVPRRSAGAQVVVMLSGGRDSVCLLDVAVALCGAEHVRALHVNYGLRVESEEDERHCRALCDLMAVQIEVVRAGRREAGGNLHAWARELRYAAANELAARLDEHSAVDGCAKNAPGGLDERSAVEGRAEDAPGGLAEGSGVEVSIEHASRAREHSQTHVSSHAPRAHEHRQAHTSSSLAAIIASGHTASDQVETILYRLAASPGRRALLGMPVSEGRLVRPILGLTREATGAYCLERNLSWREDASNDSRRYARARVRHGLLPAFDAVHPAAQANVLRTAELLREETELLDALVDAELGGACSISIERLRRLQPALQRLLVIRLAEDAAGTFVPQAGDRVAEILALAARGGRAELHIGGLAGAVIQAGELRMVRISPRRQH
jgi:tRNA(Ile)-lysidine synthase TilS/MesJ